MKYNWDWSIYLQQAADGSGTWIHYLVVGLGWTLATALAAWVIALTIGSRQCPAFTHQSPAVPSRIRRPSEAV